MNSCSHIIWSLIAWLSLAQVNFYCQIILCLIVGHSCSVLCVSTLIIYYPPKQIILRKMRSDTQNEIWLGLKYWNAIVNGVWFGQLFDQFVFFFIVIPSVCSIELKNCFWCVLLRAGLKCFYSISAYLRVLFVEFLKVSVTSLVIKVTFLKCLADNKRCLL